MLTLKRTFFSKRINNCTKFIRQFWNMDSDEDVDTLYGSHTKLKRLIVERGNEEGIKQYLKTLTYPPVEDFATGLEWFNVSEPLSFAKHLKGKVVVLDFFTYCCINCMHILPDLRQIESEISVEDGLVVIGVHSAKFENEKVSSNILSAVQRYNIGHPVVNDYTSDMWRKCDVHCWPTLLILGPNANPIVMLTGEGHRDDLRLYINHAIKFYNEKNLISNHKLPFKSAYHLLPDLKGPLLFPGKIASFTDHNNHEILALSDTGNSRILIIEKDGTIVEEIGGKSVGFKDGKFTEAEFDNPQGLCFLNKNVVFVADTENHAIRKIDLEKKEVETVAGNGHQGHDRVGGKKWNEQIISSPWDVCVYKTCQPEDNREKSVLIIAMAGTHQIWALFLDNTVWWKDRNHPAGSCIAIAGSGREENRNNNYPHAAAFAQPSGLALSNKNKEIYIADSESSSVRKLSLIDGKVSAVVGGNRNPNDLFAFGDKDGCLYDAKLQHSLGLAVSKDESVLFVADTYNHKLKKIDISKNYISTLNVPLTDTTDGTSFSFNEPSGLCISSDSSKIYVADTNNHFIKVIKLENNEKITQVQKLDLKLNKTSDKKIDKSKFEVLQTKKVSVNENGGKLILALNIEFENGLKLTSDAPQKWFVDSPNATWSFVPGTGTNIKEIDIVVSIPEGKQASNSSFDVIFSLVTCTDDTCMPKNFIVRNIVFYEKSGASSVSEKVNVVLSPNSFKMK